MDASTIVTVLTAAARAGVVPCLWGDPGTGKSSLARAVAAAQDVPCEVVLGSLREPSDFAGLPVVTDAGVSLHAPAWARRAAEHGRGVVLLDELTTVSPAVQAAMLGVVLDRMVGDLRLPDTVAIIAAANPPENAADGYDLAPPLANRLLHITYSPDPADWLTGMTAGFTLPAGRRVLETTATRTALARANVSAFLRHNPALLHRMPTDAASTGRAWPSRRTWTMTADVLAVLSPDDQDAALLATSGLVGDGPAAEYLTWRAHADLPDPQAVLDDPSNAPWADLDPSRTWALLSSVVALCTGPGTITAWRSAWAVLAAATDHGRADVAAACARALLTARPAGARPPREAKAFTAVLADAGLL